MCKDAKCEDAKQNTVSKSKTEPILYLLEMFKCNFSACLTLEIEYHNP